MSASQILPAFFSPILLTLLLVLLGVVMRNRFVSVLSVVFLLVVSLPGLIFPIYDWHQSYVRRDVVSISDCRADAIVVLAGAMTLTPREGGSVVEWGDAIDRVLGGVSLWELGCAQRLVLMSGTQVPDGAELEGRAMQSLAEQLGVPSRWIEVLPVASNTEQEAETAREALIPKAPNIILVTSAFHMRRASMLFRDRGFLVSEYPVDIRVPLAGTGPAPWIPNVMALQRTDIMFRETLGFAYYRLKIWAQSK